jgi:hypothetical protein
VPVTSAARLEAPSREGSDGGLHLRCATRELTHGFRPLPERFPLRTPLAHPR